MAITQEITITRRGAWLPRFAGVLLLTLVGCSPEQPPRPEGDRAGAKGAAVQGAAQQSGQADADEAPSFLPGDDQFVLTYAGDRGAFSDCQAIDEVPEGSRGMVGVNVFGLRPPAGKLWVTNLGSPGADGRYALQAVPREQFEEVILGAGRSSKFELPEGLELPDVQPAAAEGPIIVYKTSWCGVCKQLEAYLKRKGVDYVAKDIEKDQAAAAELAAKAKAASVPMGSVPMIDVGGELLRGFDRNRLEELL